jgi:hypothetical protein
LRLKISEKIRGRYSSVLDSGEVEDGLTWQTSRKFTGLVDAMTLEQRRDGYKERRGQVRKLNTFLTCLYRT